MYRHFFKRFFDLILSFLGIIVLSLPMIILGIIIKCDSKGPVFFRQERCGRNKKPFKVFKFRTMRVDAPHDCPTWALDNPDTWITKVGAFLRKTSIDEIPQIFNIFLGHMSLIGPRPVVCCETELIEAREKYGANAVRPGLSGWAQVNGRDEVMPEEKAKLDGEYVKKMGFFFDAKCFFLTIGVVLKGKGVKEGSVVKQELVEVEGVLADVAITEEFDGENSNDVKGETVEKGDTEQEIVKESVVSDVLIHTSKQNEGEEPKTMAN